MSKQGSLKLKVQRAPAQSKTEPAPERAILKVLVDTGVFHLDQPYDYLLPAKYHHSVEVGSIVKVPFGNRTCTGLVVARISQEPAAGTKFIDSQISTIPVLDPSIISLLQAAAQRYACDIWELIPEALPGRVAGVERLFSKAYAAIQQSKDSSLTHSLKILSPGISYITQIKGVGTWTAEMMLIFGMGRPDVFPLKDLGIQQAMCRLFEWPHLSPKQLNERMIQASAMWAPYRTYAALTLWRYKDEVKSI